MQTCLEEEMNRFRSSGMLAPPADALYKLSGNTSNERLAHMSSPSAFFPSSDLFEFILQFIPAGKAACLRVGGHVGREGVNLLLL